MVGDGDLRRECQRFAASRGLPVTFTGFLNQGEISAAYAAADCLVLPSDGETWGLVVNEAMACELPAIVSVSCGCSVDLIIEGKTGFLYACGDEFALYLNMCSMLRQSIDQCDFEIFRKKFNKDTAADVILASLITFGQRGRDESAF